MQQEHQKLRSVAGRGAPGAVVLGGTHKALGIVRSLGERGIPVAVVEGRNEPMAGRSRFSVAALSPPAGPSTPDWLLELADTAGIGGWVLFPTGDGGVTMLGREHARLSERFRIASPPLAGMQWAYDKVHTYRLAAEARVPHPWTHVPESREELHDLACRFPVVLKPAYKSSSNPFTYARAWLIPDRPTLLRRYDEAASMVPRDSIMVQELLTRPAEGQFSFGALCQDGQVLGSIVARRLRQYPVDFGRASTLVESVEQPLVEEYARRLLAVTRHTGLVELEFKLDPADGTLKLLDANPRIWVWYALGRRAGVDFPYLLWRQALGEPARPEVRARVGVRWWRASTDVPAAAIRLRRGELSVADYARSLRPPIQFSVVSARDPLPMLGGPATLARLVVNKRRARAGRAGDRRV
jgi:predicted ATP-grasp superfamily ATP-dependent carboligase